MHGSFTNWGSYGNESLTMTMTKGQNWVTLSCINWTHSTLHYCKTFTFKQMYQKQRTKIRKDKKEKEKKKEKKEKGSGEKKAKRKNWKS